MGWSGFGGVKRGTMDARWACTRTPALPWYSCLKDLTFCIKLHYFSMKLLQIIRRMHEHNHDTDVAAIEVARVKTAIKRRAEDTVKVWYHRWIMSMVTMWWKLISVASTDYYSCAPGPKLCHNGGAPQQRCSLHDHPAKAQPDSHPSARSTQLSQFGHSSWVPDILTCSRTRIQLAFRVQYIWSTLCAVCVTVEERFLLIGMGPESAPDHILVFGCKANKFCGGCDHPLHGRHLQAGPTILQASTRRAHWEKWSCIPLLYCLLVNKQRRMYAQLFHLLHTMWPELNVSTCNFLKIWGFIPIMTLSGVVQPFSVTMDLEQAAF